MIEVTCQRHEAGYEEQMDAEKHELLKVTGWFFFFAAVGWCFIGGFLLTQVPDFGGMFERNRVYMTDLGGYICLALLAIDGYGSFYKGRQCFRNLAQQRWWCNFFVLLFLWGTINIVVLFSILCNTGPFYDLACSMRDFMTHTPALTYHGSSLDDLKDI